MSRLGQCCVSTWVAVLQGLDG